MSTIVTERTEDTQCKIFARVRGHSISACSSVVANRSDFLSPEWELADSGISRARQPEKLLQASPMSTATSICAEQEFVRFDYSTVSEACRKVLIAEAKRNIRILSLFTAEPLTSMLPYETIEHFRRLIAGFKLTLEHLENYYQEVIDEQYYP